MTILVDVISSNFPRNKKANAVTFNLWDIVDCYVIVKYARKVVRKISYLP